MGDTDTPLRFQVVLKLPSRYGETEAGRKDPLVFARIDTSPLENCPKSPNR